MFNFLFDRSGLGIVVVRGALNDHAYIDARSVKAQLEGRGDGRASRWLRFEKRMAKSGYNFEEIAAKYHNNVVLRSRIYNSIAVFNIVLAYVTVTYLHLNAPAITNVLSLYGLVSAFYLTKKYVKQSDGGFLGYRNWKMLFERNGINFNLKASLASNVALAKPRKQ